MPIVNAFHWREYPAQVYKDFLKKPNTNGGKGWMTSDSLVLGKGAPDLTPKTFRVYNAARSAAAKGKA